MTTQYTQHFRLNLPDFRMGPWHDLVNQDFENIDDLLFSIYQGVDTDVWANSTHYTPGQTVVDLTDNSYWVCIIDHTSAASGNMSADRTAHPTYWNRVVVGINPRGAWAHDTHYFPGDLVSDSVQHVIALCKTDHTSNHTGTIRDDVAYWTFIADMGSTGAVAAIQVSYDPSASGVIYTNLQATTDDLYAKHTSQQTTINSHTSSISALQSNDATQNANIASNTSGIATNTANIASNTSSISGLTTGKADINSPTFSGDPKAPTPTVGDNDTSIATTEFVKNQAYITDAPADGSQYARLNHAWSVVTGGGGGGGSAIVTISDTPPVGPTSNQLWWQSSSGSMFIYYTDANSSQWVAVLTQPSTDTPVSPGGGGVTLDPTQLGPGLLLSNGNLTVEQTAVPPGVGANVLAATHASTGKFYYEFTVNSTLANTQVGIMSNNASATRSEYLGYSAGWSQGVNWNGGWLASGGTTTSPALISGHTYGVAIDLDAKKSWIKDITAAGNWNANATADPVTGVNGATFTLSGEVYPACSMEAVGDKVTFNFGV